MPFYQAQRVTLGEDFANTVLAALKTVPGGALVTAGKLRLSKDPTFNPQPSNVIADFTANEADYSGYVSGGISVTLTAPVDLSTVCNGVLFTGLFEATTASPFVGCTVWGWWIDDGTNVICGEKFDGSLSYAFAAPGNFLSLTAIIPLQLAMGTV